MLKFILAWRYLMQKKSLFGITGTFSFFGLVIGVASLVVAMAVVSGYDSTLRKTVIDVAGEVLLVKRGKHNFTWQEVFNQTKSIESRIKEGTPFLFLEGVLAFGGRIHGIAVQGMDPETIDQVLKIRSRLIMGSFEFPYKEYNSIQPALLGKGVVKKMGLKIGDVFQVVHPVADDMTSFSFTKKMISFKLVGVLDLGKFEFDERYLVTHIRVAQKLAGIENKFSGIYLRLDNPEIARAVTAELRDKMGPSVWARDWQEVNENLFEAIKIEKVAIFLVILVLIVASAFNVASALFINVIRNYADISVLKAMGATRRMMLWVFSLQGLFIGLIGSLGGIAFGLGFCYLFEWAMARFNLLPVEIYKLNSIHADVRLSDLVIIVLVTLVICFISTLAPAFRGAKLEIVEGLRYE